MKKKTSIFLSAIFGLLMIGNILIFLPGCSKIAENSDSTDPIFKQITIEVGENIPASEDFLMKGKVKEFGEISFEIVYGEEKEGVETPTKIGEYYVKIIADGKSYWTKMFIKDTKAPEIITKNLKKNKGDFIYDALFVESCIDNSGNTCLYKMLDNKNEIVDYETLDIGKYEFTLVAYDESQNEIRKEVELELVSEDTVLETQETTPVSANQSRIVVSTNPIKITTTVKQVTTKKAITRQVTSAKTVTTTTKQTTKNITQKAIIDKQQEANCVPSKNLPDGAIWYKTWEETPISYNDYQAWAKTINDMQILLNVTKDIMLSTGRQSRTDGGLTFISCKNDSFKIYGAYILVNGYEFSYDENDEQQENQVAKGYVRPDGTLKWLYKNY